MPLTAKAMQRCSKSGRDGVSGVEAESAQGFLESVLMQHRSEWMSLPGVVGCGLGEKDGKQCIVVFVAKLTAALISSLPREVKGCAVVIEETEPFRALESM